MTTVTTLFLSTLVTNLSVYKEFDLVRNKIS